MAQQFQLHFPSSHQGEDIECVLSPETQVLRNNRGEIISVISDVRILCAYLPCLTEIDEDQITAKQNSDGKFIATLLLLKKLVCRRNFWEEFLTALKQENVGGSDVAEKLEKCLIDYKEKHKDEVNAFESTNSESSVSDQGNLDVSNTTPAPALKRKMVYDRENESDLERCAKQSRDSSDSEDEFSECKEYDSDVRVVTNTVKKLIIEGVNVEYIDLHKKDYPPRKYQLALAQPAQDGHNTIICAPTGSGKTMVASLICESHLQKSIPVKYDVQLSSHSNDAATIQPKILVIVPRFAILLHVYKELTTALPMWSVGKKSGANKFKTSLADLFKLNEVMVVTADIFKNAILSGTEKCMDITDPTLIIFDECHYTMLDHSYNIIMSEYLKVKHKMSSSKLPQIVGLSASPGAGRKISDKEAQKRILTLCANLDAEVFKTVPDNLREELEKYVSTPTKHTTIVSNLENDPFSDSISTIMKSLEVLAGIETRVPERGTQEYESLIVLKTQASLTHNQDDKRKMYDHLTHYNRAIILVNQARIIDGYNYLESVFKQLFVKKAEDTLDETESSLLERYEGQWNESISSEASNHPNPKLQHLKKKMMHHIERCEKKNENFRAMIFVKTKLLTKALQEWINDDADLNSMKPEVLTSIHADAESGGMTNAQQAATLKRFHDGDTKIIISTSVGEEGIDIPECNMVVKYDHVTNEIAMVQSRGRARKCDAVELVIGDLTVAEKDKVNVLLEEKMENAISAVQMMGNEEFKKYTELIQKLELNKREQKSEKQKELKNLFAAEDIELKCKGCDEIVCKVSDIRILGNNAYINPDPEFRKKVKFVQGTSLQELEHNIDRIYCAGAKCGAKWGITAGNHPCLGLKSFITVINGAGKAVKQWSKMPCTIQKYSYETD